MEPAPPRDHHGLPADGRIEARLVQIYRVTAEQVLQFQAPQALHRHPAADDVLHCWQSKQFDLSGRGQLCHLAPQGMGGRGDGQHRHLHAVLA